MQNIQSQKSLEAFDSEEPNLQHDPLLLLLKFQDWIFLVVS